MRELTEERQKLIFLAGIAASGAVAGLDYLTGTRFPLAVIYLLPLYFVTLKAGKGFGLILALVCIGFQWAAAHFTGGQRLPFSAALWQHVSWAAVYLLGVIMTTRLQRALSRTQALSLTDFLTGALNSRALYNLVENEHLKSKRFGRPMTLAYIGIDNFKAVNNRFGHTVGDTLLRKVARTMMRCLRATDRVARLGGDEYVVLLPETDQGAARVVIPKVCDRLTELMADHRWPVTLSVGVVTFVTVPKSPREMIQAAERLMQTVKKTGKNNTRYAAFHG